MSEYNGKPTVAHFPGSYLPLSKTFIYQYLKNLQAFRPVVIAETIQNLDNFPLNHNIHCLSDVWKRWTWKWFRSRIDERILKKAPYESLLREVFAKERPKLLHAHFGSRGVWALSLKEQYNLPLITTFYGVDMSKLPRQEKWREAYKKLFAEGDVFLVEGGHMAHKLIKLSCPAEKVRLIHISIDVDRLEFQPRRFPEDGTVRLLMCGRFTEKKGIGYAIRAFSLVCAEYKKKLELRIIGDGELRDDIEGLIGELNLENHVNLLGYQPHSTFIEELGKSHIFLAPSVTAADGDSEGGAPTVLIEAQAAGLPIVSTYHADIPEVVLDKRSGFLVPERDVEALAERMNYLLKHPDIWADMGRAGREHVEENYNIRLEAEKLEGVYREVISDE